MPIDPNPFDERPDGISRRQMIRTGVWAAPALVLAVAAPAAAASVVGGILSAGVTQPAYSDDTDEIEWGGASIFYDPEGAGARTVNAAWVFTATGPQELLNTSGVSVFNGGGTHVVVPAQNFPQPLLPGEYTFTLTVTSPGLTTAIKTRVVTVPAG